MRESILPRWGRLSLPSSLFKASAYTSMEISDLAHLRGSTVGSIVSCLTDAAAICRGCRGFEQSSQSSLPDHIYAGDTLARRPLDSAAAGPPGSCTPGKLKKLKRVASRG